MRRHHIGGFSLNSIRFKLIAGAGCVLVPLIGLLIYNNMYAINVIHNQVAESNRNMLVQYMKQIDNSLDVLDNYLSTMAAFDSDIQILSMSTDADSRLVSTANLSEKLSKDILAYRSMDCIFVYNKLSQDFIYGKGESESINERDGVRAYVISLINAAPQADTHLQRSGWVIDKINGQYYLIRLFRSDSSYVGAWVSAKNLMGLMNYTNMSKGGAYLLTTSRGKWMFSSTTVEENQVDVTRDFRHYYLTGKNNQYLLVGATSQKGNFNLIALIQDNEILENLPILKHVITTIAFGAILLLPLSLFLLSKAVIIPLYRIVSAMKKVRDGNIEIRMKPYNTSDEFRLVNETFNTMLDQIHELKINVYEEQLSKQKAELEHLQLQVNPHFFLNSLNILYRLAQTKKYELIQEMSLCLLQYFRYMFRNNHAFVPLRDELQHVRNYIRIQELRFPGSLTSDIQVDEFLLDKPIPPLVIQNFVENSVKYAVNLDELVHLSIEVDYKKTDENELMRILIRDTGKGFSKEVLNGLKAGKHMTNQHGEHIGIWNVQRRLQLLYPGKAAISFSNQQPCGAVVEMTLPLTTPTQLLTDTDNCESEG